MSHARAEQYRQIRERKSLMSQQDSEPQVLMLGAPQARQGSTPRAVRNHNPGNIERGIKWIGLQKEADMTAAQRAENRFAVFSHPKYGFRAMATVILTYARKRRAKDGSAIDTIGEVVARWAPPVENDTRAYAQQVARAVGVGMDQLVNLEDWKVLQPMVKAMAIHEAGGWFWKDADLDEGLRLAGIARPSASPVAKTEATVIGVGVAAAGVGGIVEIIKQSQDIIETARPAIDGWRQLYDVAPTSALVVAGLSLLFAGYRWIQRIRRTTA